MALFDAAEALRSDSNDDDDLLGDGAASLKFDDSNLLDDKDLVALQIDSNIDNLINTPNRSPQTNKIVKPYPLVA
jgi:hypothetical protein